MSPTETTVLILGENGTGKERLADLIHHLSPRKNKPFIKVNCAALPTALIESELFGHEKGSFTGATERRIGKFEQAEGGTIFLDEIGEMSLDLQVKLLRVLQEKEIDRIGGKSTVRVNIRIVAATNKDLEKEVSEGRFRIDLFYRLHVFPLISPPLRDRKEDIPLLTKYFISLYSSKVAKSITGVSEELLAEMMSYSWPGNVRELEHFVERSVLLSQGNTLQWIPLPKFAPKQSSAPATGNQNLKTMEENERDYILLVLEKCGGKVSGPGGAAECLNLPVSTLNSRMKKLGIGLEKRFN